MNQLWHLSNVFIGCVELALGLMITDIYMKRRERNKKYIASLYVLDFVILYSLGLILEPSLIKGLLSIGLIFINMLLLYEGRWEKLLLILAAWSGVTIVSDSLAISIWADFLETTSTFPVQYNVIRTLMGIAAKVVAIMQVHVYYRLANRREIPFSYGQLPLHLAPVITILVIDLIIVYGVRPVIDAKESILIISVCMGLLVSNIFTWKIFNGMIFADRARRHSVYIQNKMKEQYKHYLTIEQNQEEIRKLYHDMHNHLYCIGGLIKNNHLDQASNYVEEVSQKLHDLRNEVRTGHYILDVILREKYHQAKSHGIDMEIQVQGELMTFIKDIDLCSIYGNLLDNALEACMAMKKQDTTSKTIIQVKTLEVKGVKLVSVSNTHQTLIQKKQGHLLTTKKDKKMHGMGLGNVRNITEAYDGALHMNYDEEWFHVKLIF
ncbi:MAG: sensor histidine kinase [Cellulosilyticaceae bacterium]